MAGQVVEDAAGGDDVDEAEQGGAQRLVRGGVVHGPAVQRLERVPGRGGEPGVQLAADPLGLALEGVGVDHADGYTGT